MSPGHDFVEIDDGFISGRPWEAAKGAGPCAHLAGVKFKKCASGREVGRLYFIGVVVFDESSPSLSREIRRLLAEFQAGGTRWASLGCIIETAFFFDSRSSRLMQIADFAAYAVYRWYEHADDSYLKLINNKFDRQASKLHGLKCYPLESTQNYQPKPGL